MATLYGQNLRVWTDTNWGQTSTVDYRVIAAATNCTVNYTKDTADATHKDIHSMFQNPEGTNKRCSVTVESLYVDEFDLLLQAILANKPFYIRWDESGGEFNQQPLECGYHQAALAYISDFTLTANNRENCTFSVTFTTTGPVQYDSDPNWSDADVFTTRKGQKMRLMIGDDSNIGVIAAAMQLSFHVSVSLEDATTKDTVEEWAIVEPTGISYDISSTALIRSGETITSLERSKDLQALLADYSGDVVWRIGTASGPNNRQVTPLVTGTAIITSITLNGPNRQKATYSFQMQGVGAFALPQMQTGSTSISNGSNSGNNGGQADPSDVTP